MSDFRLSLIEQLRLCCDLIYIFFAFDNVTDVLPQQEVLQIGKALLDALRRPEKPRPHSEMAIIKMGREYVPFPTPTEGNHLFFLLAHADIKFQLRVQTRQSCHHPG